MHPQEHMKLYETRINLHCFDEVAALISADAVFWFTDGTHRGIDAIKIAFEETWSKLHNEVYWLEDVDWIAISDMAASCIYRFHWTASVDGKAYKGGGRGTSVLRKEGAQWKIVHEHLSRFPR